MSNFLPNPTCSNCAYFNENAKKCLKSNRYISKKMARKDRSMCSHYLYCMEDVDISEQKIKTGSSSNVTVHCSDEWREWRKLPL